MRFKPLKLLVSVAVLAVSSALLPGVPGRADWWASSQAYAATQDQPAVKLFFRYKTPYFDAKPTSASRLEDLKAADYGLAGEWVYVEPAESRDGQPSRLPGRGSGCGSHGFREQPLDSPLVYVRRGQVHRGNGANLRHPASRCQAVARPGEQPEMGASRTRRAVHCAGRVEGLDGRDGQSPGMAWGRSDVQTRASMGERESGCFQKRDPERGVKPGVRRAG